MKGTMMTIPANGPLASVALAEPPALETLQQAVGGFLEVVPHLRTLETKSGTVPCVAFCNEEGKLDRPHPLPKNPRANLLWSAAMQREYGCGPEPDYLVGTIVVLFGDDAFMETL